MKETPEKVPIRARFICTEVGKHIGYGPHKFLYSATFKTLSEKNADDIPFLISTNGGSIVVTTVIGDHFEVGKVYNVDFTEEDN